MKFEIRKNDQGEEEVLVNDVVVQVNGFCMGKFYKTDQEEYRIHKSIDRVKDFLNDLEWAMGLVSKG
jgi:ABC-type enterochelin transport system substrate-binding protein